MVEISLSTIAWISVVLIQAVVHWMVFGGGSKMKIKNQHDQQQQQQGDQKQAATSAAALTSSSPSPSSSSCTETEKVTTHQGEGDDENDNDDIINPRNLFLGQRRSRQLFDVDTDDDDDDYGDNDQDFYRERRVDNDDDDDGDVQAQSTQITVDVPPQAQSRSRSTTPGRRRLSSSSASSPPTMTMMAPSSPLTPSPNATKKTMKSLSSSSSSPFLQDYGHDQLFSSLNHRREGRSWPSSFSSSSLSPTISSRTMLKLGGGLGEDSYTKSTNTDADIVTLAMRTSSVLSIRDVSTTGMLEDDQEDEELSPLDLSQTGSELFKNCSVDNMVEEQIRAVPQ